MIVQISFLWVEGMALWPFVLVRQAKPNVYLLNHERIHLRQQLELGLLPFYIWYGVEYLIRRLQYKDHYKAYCNISFEREAYANDHNLTYRQYRPWYAFVKYLKGVKK